MKMAASITTSISAPRNSSPVTSYLELLAVLEFAPEADLVPALERLGNALDDHQQRGNRHCAAERPHDGPPDALLRALAHGEGVPGAVDAHRHEENHGGKEQHQVGNQVDDPLAALR